VDEELSVDKDNTDVSFERNISSYASRIFSVVASSGKI
jgi:hypothetical protein